MKAGENQTCTLIHGSIYSSGPAIKPVSYSETGISWKLKTQTTESKHLRLEDAGWNVVVIWECEIRSPDIVEERLVEFLEP